MTPRAALAWDCGAIKMKYRIMEKKLNFLNYILNQSENSLAYQILKEQKENDFPGLVKECTLFIDELKIEDPFMKKFSKLGWKRIVKKAILEANSIELKNEILEYKKLKNADMKNEQFERKNYIRKLNLQQARTKFKYRCSMTQHVKMNQKNNQQ